MSATLTNNLGCEKVAIQVAVKSPAQHAKIGVSNFATSVLAQKIFHSQFMDTGKHFERNNEPRKKFISDFRKKSCGGLIFAAHAGQITATFVRLRQVALYFTNMVYLRFTQILEVAVGLRFSLQKVAEVFWMSRFARILQASNEIKDAQYKDEKPVAESYLAENYLNDPRPDLNQDHELWVILLSLLRATNEELFGILHGLRCGGAFLEKDKDYGLVIKPGEWTPEEYAAFRTKWLVPRKDEVLRALKAAAIKCQENTRDSTVITRIKSVEPRLRAAGWTDSEIWAPNRFNNNGWWMESVYAALREQPEYEIGEITADYVELILRRSSGDIKHRLFCRPPGGGRRPQLFADQKSKEVV